MINNKNKDKVKLTMHGYIHLLVGELPTGMTETSVVPTTNYLFQIQEDQDRIRLSPEDVVNLHNLRAKLLFLLKQMQPDLQVAVSFLCTPVRDPDTDDRKKLSKVIICLQTTLGLQLILHIDSSSNT